jgi:uncharacterized protein (DUF1778 family)
MTQTNKERGRITGRVSKDIQKTLEQAAELQGVTLRQFVVQAALGEARRIVERHRVIHLSRVDAAFLLDLLENPPGPNARLRKAFQTYKKRLQELDDYAAVKIFRERPGRTAPLADVKKRLGLDRPARRRR